MGASACNEVKQKEKNKLKNEIKEELKNDSRKDLKDEVIIGPRFIPINILFTVMKAICKIRIQKVEGIAHGTGFFLNYLDSKKYLMTCYHVINPNLRNEQIEIEIYNKKIMKLNFK